MAQAANEKPEYEHVIDTYPLQAPDYIRNAIKKLDMRLYPTWVGGKEIFILMEQQPCHPSGCTNVILTLSEGKLHDPVIFLSDDEFPPDEKGPPASAVWDVCVAQRNAFPCWRPVE